MRALLLAALLARPASAAKPVETPRAPTPDLPALPAAVATPQVETAAAEAPASEALHYFDGTSLESWERLERTLLDAAGLDVPSRAVQWRQGVAHSLRERPTSDNFGVLERNLAAAHALDIEKAQKLSALLREQSELNFYWFKRVFSTDDRLFAVRDATYDLLERQAGEWKHIAGAPAYPPAADGAAAAGLPKDARLAPSGAGKIALSGNSLYLRRGDSWARRTLTAKVADAAVHRGLVYAATDRGLVPLVPKAADWSSAMRRALADLPAMEAAGKTTTEGDAWRALEAAVEEGLGLAAAGSAPAWREAAAAALRQAPDAPLPRALGQALASTLGLHRSTTERAAALLGGDTVLRGGDAALFQDGGDVFAAVGSELYRLKAGTWKRVLSAAGVGRVEKRDGGLLVGSHGRGLELWTGGQPRLLLNGSVHDFLTFGADRFLVATDNSLWRKDGRLSSPVALSGHKVYKLVARGETTYAATSKGFFELLRLNLPPRALLQGMPVRDALSEDGAWLLAADRGLYEIEGGEVRWVPESLGQRFIALRRSRNGVLALSEDGLALIRQEGRWRRAPEMFQGARDFVEGRSLSYVADARGVRVVADLPPGWQASVAADLAPLVERLSAEAAGAAAEPKAGASLRDSRGRSLLGP